MRVVGNIELFYPLGSPFVISLQPLAKKMQPLDPHDGSLAEAVRMQVIARLPMRVVA